MVTPSETPLRMKYRPDFPERFGSIEHGRLHCGDFFPWYNTEHHHVGLGLFTRHNVHYGLATTKREQRGARVGRGVRAAPRAVSERAAHAEITADRSLDQPTQGTRRGRGRGQPHDPGVRRGCDWGRAGILRCRSRARARPGILSGSFQVSDVRSPLNGLQEDALLAHALHCRKLAAYLLIRANAVGAKCSGEGAELGGP